MTPTASTHHAEVDDHAAVGAPDQPAPPADVARACAARTESTRARAAVAAGHGAEAEADQGGEAAQAEGDAEHDRADPDPHGDRQALPQHGAAHLAPAEHRRDRHEEEQGEAGRDGDRVEEGRADGHLLLGDRLVEERVHGAEQHDEGEARRRGRC